MQTLVYVSARFREHSASIEQTEPSPHVPHKYMKPFVIGKVFLRY